MDAVSGAPFVGGALFDRIEEAIGGYEWGRGQGS